MLSIEPTPYNSFRIRASSDIELASAFLRLQEHYESPNNDFRCRPFTIGEYKRWYTQRRGAFTYYSDWTGFNIPSQILIPFLNGLFDPLTRLEKELIDFFRYSSMGESFYIIGANNIDVLNHELNHALFDYSKSYRTSITKLFDSNLDHIKPAMEYLIHKGYHAYMLYDELQSYILDKDEDIIELITNPNIVPVVLNYYREYGEDHYEN
jgi:hypothetical protein